MKFIITEFFETQFHKAVKDISLWEIIRKINVNSKNFIQLKEPYIKVKIKTETKSYRVLIVFDRENSLILFVNIFDKKDKNYGENLTWTLHKNDILMWQRKNEECVKNGKYYKEIV